MEIFQQSNQMRAEVGDGNDSNNTVEKKGGKNGIRLKIGKWISLWISLERDAAISREMAPLFHRPHHRPIQSTVSIHRP